MKHKSSFFATAQEGDTIVLTPQVDMGETNADQINAEVGQVLALLNNSQAKYVVLDFHKTEYFGSTALGLFVRLWKTVSGRKGRMAFCNLSDHEKDILRITRLDSLWHICSSKEDALQRMKDEG
jgi:anti-anti-sigma factor